MSLYYSDMKSLFSKRWYGPGGCAEVLSLSVPLIISIGSESIQMFIDRTFLAWYSADAMSAALQGGITNFAIASMFVGTISYVNTFVSQYTGAELHNRVGPSVWQGIYLAIISGVLLLFLIPITGWLFDLIGHNPNVRRYEVVYFKILCVGILPMLAATVLSSFFTGRGDTKTVMYANLLATLVNIVLDYVMIFGKFGFPKWGVAGAAWATVIASVVPVVIYCYIFFKPKYRSKYSTLSGYKFDLELVKRILKYGFPNGVQIMLEVSAFTVFIIFVGRIDNISLAATSIAFSVNHLAFMPMLGIGTGVSILVGQSLGRNNPAMAQRSTWSGFYITYFYMFLIAMGYWFFPKLFLYPFSVETDPQEFLLIEPIAIKLLCFVAFYCLFDTGNIIFSAALKGAGDTRFVMIMTIILSWTIMVLPSWIAVKYGYGLYMVWGFATAYVCILALLFFVRFLAGKWKEMRVIEVIPPKLPPKRSDLATIDIEVG